ncbi:TonB-linked outer membrane protein, SusC/RagA family [Capnocytophaga haemolytica]|uniref:Outer membrane receptor for ferrienterochelin and colicins n=3 Tax=Capnocytophaga haemolytica TaxID=45243 RepID=A0AAX2GZG9_9FLAO|nr:TonB-linked outer membrane protein, SusC/RagA family [Capnocytophaga haemolytica]SNV13773.1 Outer membrane receptor for ferrienterochelin and colicins [Capnocytophaga haemolytica]
MFYLFLKNVKNNCIDVRKMLILQRQFNINIMNNKMRILLFLFAMISSVLFAQEKTVKGVVTDQKGMPLPGVSVVLKNSNPPKGVATDFDGNYEINVKNGSVLIFSSVGFTTQEKTAQGSGSSIKLNVTLKEEAQQLGEVVVTALGIKREEKALPYAAQQVKTEELTKVKDANFINALNGKVAGVTINRSSSGIGGASRVVMRGSKSIEKSNNALYVVDGVPMLSLTSKQGEGRFQSAGSTESIADINPDDIESMTVLTGASAAALYGSAAANGAILITTKKGKEGKMNIQFSSTSEVASPLMLPDFQNKYGNDGAVTSWGAALPEGAARYNVKDFFRPSTTFTNSVSLSGGTEKNQTYFSAASTNAQGIIPNNTYNRYNFTVRNTTHLLNDKLRIDASAGYILQNNLNMINQGEYMNPLVSAYLMPRGYGLDRAKAFEQYNPTTHIYEQVWGDLKAGSDGTFGGTFAGDYTLQNPYWEAYRNLREAKRNRYLLSLGVSLDLKQWSPTEKWDISGRIRTDNTHFTNTNKLYASTLAAGTDVSKTGFFGIARGYEKQTYMDVLTNLTKNFGKFSLMVNVGASLQDTRRDELDNRGPLRGNGIPNVFNIQNIDQAAAKTKLSQSGYTDQTQSIFGSVELGYNRWVYLTLTGRNDWASQLANSPQSSFFYPSVGLSSVLTDLLSDEAKTKLYPKLSFAKVRLAFSSVGSPFDRELTTPSYTFDQDSKTWKSVSYFPIGSLYPERTDSYEVGIATKWLKGKLTFDATFYQTNTYNQTIKAEISPSTGYDGIYLQTGDVRNRGIEVGLGYDLKIKEKFNWNSYFTMSYNENKIMSLVEDYVNPVTGKSEGRSYLEKGGLGGAKYILRTGGTLGDVYATNDFRRDADGNILTDANGNVNVENYKDFDQYKKLGSVLPKYNLGWRNDFSFGNVGFGVMFAGRVGGIAVSMTEAALDHYGVSKNSADARDAGGVDLNGFKANAKSYFEERGKNRIAQYYTYSATNFRLQEAYISYKLPRKLINNTMDLTLSIVGRNLAMLYCKAPFDPEAISSTSNYSQGLDYFMMPSLRSYGLSLKANF